MFERILIKSESNTAERYLSIADLVDIMFYYGEVHVVISQFELKQLLTTFGEDVLFELITTERLSVHPCDQHIGASRYGGLESVGLFRRDFKGIDELLYHFHKETIQDDSENKRFADRFSRVLTEYRFPQDIQKSLYDDVENDDLLSRATRVFIKQYYPGYRNIEDICVRADSKVSSFMNFYKITGNLRIDELDSIHRLNGYTGSFSYSTVLMALGETHIDCFFASELEAELITNRRWAEVYKLRMNTSISRAEGSLKNINHFQEMAANDFLSPGQAFVMGMISPKDLLKELNSNDSVKFRKWLAGLLEGKPLTGELYKAIQNKNSSKPWVKCTRSISQIVTGILNPVLGAAHTLLDGCIGDKLINGWEPSMFISNVLNQNKLKRTISNEI